MFSKAGDELRSFFGKKEKILQTEFNIHRGKVRKISVDTDNKPIGGSWAYN